MYIYKYIIQIQLHRRVGCIITRFISGIYRPSDISRVSIHSSFRSKETVLTHTFKERSSSLIFFTSVTDSKLTHSVEQGCNLLYLGLKLNNIPFYLERYELQTFFICLWCILNSYILQCNFKPRIIIL